MAKGQKRFKRGDTVRIIISTLIFCCCLFNLNVYGSTTDEIWLEGTVHSFTNKQVVVESGNTLWEVPRRFVKHSDLSFGEPIKIGMKKAELEKIKHRPTSGK